MSRQLKELVFGVRRFGPARTGPYRRIVMLSLADRVASEDGVSCYPGLQDTAERTELGLSTTKRILAQLMDPHNEENRRSTHGCWLRKETRPGFGTTYFLNVARLQSEQRPEIQRKRESRLSRPVASQPVTGQLPLDGPSDVLSWPLSPSHNRKNPFNPSAPLRDARKVARAKKRPAAKAKPTDPRQHAVRLLLEDRVARLGVVLPEWNAAPAGRLGQLLRGVNQPVAFFEMCAENWYRSASKHHAIGSYQALIQRLLEYQSGPKDKFSDVPMASKPASKPRSAIQKVRAA